MSTTKQRTNPKEDRKQAAKDAIERMHQRLGEDILNDEDWRSRLDFLRKLHAYSPRNAMILMFQWEERQRITKLLRVIEAAIIGTPVSYDRPDMTYVAAGSTWKSMGGNIRKGEKALEVTAPIYVKDKENLDAEGKPKQKFIGYTIARGSFDISQIEGVEAPPEMVKLLEGEAPEGIIEKLLELIDALGFTYVGEQHLGGANGVMRPTTKEVAIRPGLEPAQQVKTLIHEIAHVLLHSQDRGLLVRRDVIETEAESTAYVVGQALDLDTSDYSFGYVAGWSKGDGELLASTIARVIKAAVAIQTYLEDGTVPSFISVRPVDAALDPATEAA